MWGISDKPSQINPRPAQNPRPHSPSCLFSPSVERPVLSEAQRVERWSVSGRLLVGHRSFAGRLVVGHRSVGGRLVVGHRSVGGRLVVGLKRPSATPTASQSITRQALAKNQAQQTDIQLNCAQFRADSASTTQSKALGRKRAIAGSKRGGSTSLWGDSGEVGGLLRHRFRAGLSTAKKHPAHHKHRPHQYLTFPPTIPTRPNTNLCAPTRAKSHPPRPPHFPPPFCILHFLHSEICMLPHRRSCVGYGPVMCWLCVGHVSVMRWLCVGYVSICTAKRHNRKHHKPRQRTCLC